MLVPDIDLGIFQKTQRPSSVEGLFNCLLSFENTQRISLDKLGFAALLDSYKTHLYNRGASASTAFSSKFLRGLCPWICYVSF